MQCSIQASNASILVYIYSDFSIHSMLLAKGTVTTPRDASLFLKEVLASENV